MYLFMYAFIGIGLHARARGRHTREMYESQGAVFFSPFFFHCLIHFPGNIIVVLIQQRK